jgi:hypothetical protein
MFFDEQNANSRRTEFHSVPDGLKIRPTVIFLPVHQKAFDGRRGPYNT